MPTIAQVLNDIPAFFQTETQININSYSELIFSLEQQIQREKSYLVIIKFIVIITIIWTIVYFLKNYTGHYDASKLGESLANITWGVLLWVSSTSEKLKNYELALMKINEKLAIPSDKEINIIEFQGLAIDILKSYKLSQYE